VLEGEQVLVVSDPPTRFVCKLVAMLGMTGSLASTAAGLFAPVFRMPKPTGPYRQGLPTRSRLSFTHAITALGSSLKPRNSGSEPISAASCGMVLKPRNHWELSQLHTSRMANER
jgi:hypothetical protein